MAERQEGVVQTGWGYELVWANKENYCGKILVFEKAGNKTPMHYHSVQEKTWFVNNGKFILRWIDTTTATLMQQEIAEGATWTCTKLQPHQLEALEDGASVTEVSTSIELNDVFNVIPGTNKE